MWFASAGVVRAQGAVYIPEMQSKAEQADAPSFVWFPPALSAISRVASSSGVSRSGRPTDLLLPGTFEGGTGKLWFSLARSLEASLTTSGRASGAPTRPSGVPLPCSRHRLVLG